MKKLSIFIIMLAFASMTVGARVASAATFPQCPAVGNDSNGCELLITVTGVNGAGAATAFTVSTSTPDQGPFDGGDDTLVGVLNSSGSILKSLGLSSGTNIFAFENDGACSGLFSPEPTLAQCGLSAYSSADPADYGSAVVTFSGITAGGTIGTVNFNPNLANGGSAFFSLEEALTASQILPASPTPEPSSLVLLGTGALGAIGALRRRLKV